MGCKKAIAINFVAITLLIMTILVVMLLFEGRIGELYEAMVNKNVCKSSVYSQHLSAIKNVALPSDIKCPMQRIEISEKKPEEIKRKLADLYAAVCDEFGQGRLNLFGNRETTFCVIRDKISFKQKGIKINDFAKYLAETKIPHKEVTYAEFCSGFKTERADELFKEEYIAQLEDKPIDTSKEYVIIFIYAKGEEELRELQKFFIGSSTPHVLMYVGTALSVGGAYMLYTGFVSGGAGFVGGILLRTAGAVALKGGLTIGGLGTIMNWLTNPDIRMEWASFFVLREFNEEELKKLPCKYMAAEQ
jgi:hypothetical protein